MKLVPNKSYDLSFESEIIGVDISTLKAYLRMYINGIEYGIPATIHENMISVSIPPLTSFVKQPFEEETEIPVKLEIVGPELYLCVWEDTFVVKPIVKAHVVPTNVKGGSKVKVTGVKKSVVEKETLTDTSKKQLDEAKEIDSHIKKLIKAKMKKAGLTH